MNKLMQSDEVYAEVSAGDEGKESKATQTAAIFSLPIMISVSIGRAVKTVEELLSLTPQMILELDTGVDDPVELLVGDRVIARGSLVELADGSGIGVEVTELVDGGLRA